VVNIESGVVVTIATVRDMIFCKHYIVNTLCARRWIYYFADNRFDLEKLSADTRKIRGQLSGCG